MRNENVADNNDKVEFVLSKIGLNIILLTMDLNDPKRLLVEILLPKYHDMLTAAPRKDTG